MRLWAIFLTAALLVTLGFCITRSIHPPQPLMVLISRTGHSYHRTNCPYAGPGALVIASGTNALAGRTPCKHCHPE